MTDARSLPKEKVHAVSRLDLPFLAQEREHDLQRLSDLQVTVREASRTEDIPPALLLTIWTREKKTHKILMTSQAARRLVIHLNSGIQHHSNLYVETE